MALPHEPLKGYLANVEAELSEAVRECESLRADNARLRAALWEIRENIVVASVCRAYLDSIDEIARAALGEER